MKVIYFQVRQKYVYKSLIYIDLRTRFHNQTLILHYTSPLEFNTTSAAPIIDIVVAICNRRQLETSLQGLK